MKTEFTGKTKVWLNDTKWKSMAELKEMLADGEVDRAADYLVMSLHDMSSSGWVEVGTASIAIELHEADDIDAKQIAALEQELQKERAEFHVRQNYILERIGKLKAITFESGVIDA